MTVDEMKTELVKERADAETKRVAMQAEIKKLEGDHQDVTKKFSDLLAEHKAASTRVDELMLKLAAPGAVPGNAGDKKGSEIARSAMEKYFRRQEHTMTTEEKALVLGDNASGGVLIPAERSQRMIEKVTEVSPIRALATVMITRVNHLEIVRETGQLSAAWTAEQGTLSEDTATKFALETIPVHASNALVKVSRQMLSDSPVDIEAFLMNRAALRFGKAEGIAFITGNGVSRPQGILATPGGTAIISGTQSTLAASAGFVPDDLLDTEASLISTYAANATWVMARLTANYVRKFKDTQNRYLKMIELDALRQLEGGGRALLLDGYPLREAVDMPALASAAKVGIFADFRELYTVVDRENMIVIRDPYSSKTTGLVDYLFERRVGGQVVQPDAGVYLQTKA